MKMNYTGKILGIAAGIALSTAVDAGAQMSTKYELTITNGSQMPISPATIYTRTGTEPAFAIGSIPTGGLIQLCQMGNVTSRLSELRADMSVKFVTQTSTPILPGESRAVEIEVSNPRGQSVHFETMYGKTKDVCGVGSFSSHSLTALKQHVTLEAVQKDNTILTGAFTDPALPKGMTYLDPSVCASAMDAVTCLRELAVPETRKAQIRFFAGYFPSLITALEMKYGAPEVQTLLFPASGAIQFKLVLKH